MSPTPLPTPLPLGAAARPMRWQAALAGAAGPLMGCVGWQQAGWVGLLSAVLLSAAGLSLWRRAPVVQSSTAPDLRLPRSVVPVWTRNVTAAREHAEDNTHQVLERFACVMEHLEHALQAPGHTPRIQHPGQEDALLERHSAELNTLLSTTRLAVKLKDRMYEGVQALQAALGEMAQLAREVQTISRATHLLALNASVEATRASNGGSGGFAVVAQEVRRLAAESRQAGIRLGAHANAVQERMHEMLKEVRRHDTEDDEIELQAQEQARAVLRALLSDTEAASRANQSLQRSSRAVQEDLEKILMALQSQDRLSQMLSAVTDDMSRMSQWLEGGTDPAAQTPLQWLERLEKSYTMQEQHSSHHETVVIDKQAAVEFF